MERTKQKRNSNYRTTIVVHITMKVNERELVSVQTLAKRCYNRIAIEIMNGSIFSKELIIRLGQILRNKV